MKKIVTALQKKIGLTPNEAKILDHYLRVAYEGKFCASRRTIAEALDLTLDRRGDCKAVRRANARFQYLGILSWIRGSGGNGGRLQANQYRIVPAKIEALAIL